MPSKRKSAPKRPPSTSGGRRVAVRFGFAPGEAEYHESGPDLICKNDPSHRIGAGQYFTRVDGDAVCRACHEFDLVGDL